MIKLVEILDRQASEKKKKFETTYGYWHGTTFMILKKN